MNPKKGLPLLALALLLSAPMRAAEEKTAVPFRALAFDAVSVLIPGAKNPEQARANARASALPRLGEALHAHLAEFYAREVAAHIRGAY